MNSIIIKPHEINVFRRFKIDIKVQDKIKILERKGEKKMNTPIGQSTLGEMLPLFIIIFILFVFILLSVKMIRSGFKSRKKLKANMEKRKEETGVYHNAMFQHATGLPVPEGTLCNLFLCPDKIEIECNGNKFNLDKSKLTDVTTKTDVEIQKQLVSSAGGAVAGAVMFGALGAMIGGRTKEKESKTVSTYLIFTYKKDGELDYISFNVTNIKSASKFVSDFRSSSKEINTVNL